MENASKALIIAGAILLSILIIGLGMAVYNNASATQGKADLSSQEIMAHNATFEAYEGRIKGSQVRTLLNAIKKNNDEYADRQISVDMKSVDGNSTVINGIIDSNNSGLSGNTTMSDVVRTSTTYNVEFTFEGNDGLIDTCTINVYR